MVAVRVGVAVLVDVVAVRVGEDVRVGEAVWVGVSGTTLIKNLYFAIYLSTIAQ